MADRRTTINTRDVSKLMTARKLKSKRITNDILYYLRKLIKLARQAQQIQLLEGTEYDSLVKEFESIKEEVDRLEEEISD